MSTDPIRARIAESFNRRMNDVYADLQREFRIPSGDITPEESAVLETAQDALASVVSAWLSLSAQDATPEATPATGADNPYLALGYGAAAPTSWFRVSGVELTETVETLSDGSPDWSAEGACDPRGGDPRLQEFIWRTLDRFRETGGFA